MSEARAASAGFEELRAYRWRIFLSTWCCYAGLYFCRQAYFVVKGDLTLKLGIDAAMLANIDTAYLVAYALGELNAAAVGSRIGARRILLGGMALSIACNVAFGFANNAWTFLAFMVLNGLAQATGWSGTVGTMAQWYGRRERGQAMGLWSTCYQVGGALAKGFAAFWLGLFGWRTSFFAASVVLSGVWLLFYALQRNRPEDVGLPPVEEDERAVTATEAEPGKPGRFPPYLAGTIAMMGCFYFFVKLIRYALWFWAPYFLQLNFGLPGERAGYFSTIFDVCGFFGVIAAGFVSDRFFEGRRTTVAFVMLLGLCAGTFGLWRFGATSLASFGVAMGVIGFSLYGPDSLITGAGAIDVGSRKYALAAAGIINGMGSFGPIVQAQVIGRLYAKSPGDLGRILLLLVFAAVIATGMIALLARRARAGKANL